MSYYNRVATTFVDGSPVFKSEEDERNEGTVAGDIERAWGCDARSFGKLAPIDWWFSRHGRVVGIGELKSRTHPHSQYPTVFLNVRKWLALVLASSGMGVPAIFVVRFSDDTRWIPVRDIDASNVSVGGLTHTVKSRNDIEPVIGVPVAVMRTLG